VVFECFVAFKGRCVVDQKIISRNSGSLRVFHYSEVAATQRNCTAAVAAKLLNDATLEVMHYS